MTTPSEISLEREYVLAASQERAFQFLSNPENDKLWQSSCDQVELLRREEPVGQGSRYRIHFSFLSRKMSFEAEVTEFQPETSYGYKSTEGPMPYEGRYLLTKLGDAVQIHWRFVATPGKFFGVIPKSLIQKALDKKVDEDILRLKSLFAEVIK